MQSIFDFCFMAKTFQIVHGTTPEGGGGVHSHGNFFCPQPPPHPAGKAHHDGPIFQPGVVKPLGAAGHVFELFASRFLRIRSDEPVVRTHTFTWSEKCETKTLTISYHGEAFCQQFFASFFSGKWYINWYQEKGHFNLFLGWFLKKDRRETNQSIIDNLISWGSFLPATFCVLLEWKVIY